MYSHHRNLSPVLIVQNLFNKLIREISLNTHYLVVMKGARSASQISCLGRQIMPSNTKFIDEVYRRATEKSYSYLFLDFKPDCEEIYRFRSNILPNDGPMTVYIPLKSDKRGVNH
jgi:hypothetical protein